MKNCIKCGHDLPDEAVFCYMCGKKQITQPKTTHTKRGNGTGSVYRSGKTWTAEVTMGYRKDENGADKRVVRRKKGFATKKEANDYLPLLRPKTGNPVSVSSTEKVTLEHYWQIFSENKLQKLSKSKQGHYKTAYNKIPALMFSDMRELTIADLQDTVNEVAGTYYPARDLKTLLSHLYDLAVAEQKVPVNLAAYIELPKLEEEQPRPFTEEEIGLLWRDYVDGNSDTGYALLMIYTGMMPGELFALKTSSIDLDKKMIIGAGLKTDKRKKTPIVLADCILPVVEDLISRANGERFLPMCQWYYRQKFKEMLKRSGCREDLVLYSCRHTTATGLALENIAVPVIKEVMRHTKITTTEKYIHIADSETMLNAVNTLPGKKEKGETEGETQ